MNAVNPAGEGLREPNEDHSVNTDPRLLGFARRMRRTPSPAEKLAWRLLRGHRLAGFRFRRQHPVAPYIADFYCAVARLVVELDGDTHVGQEENDRVRTLFLESRGLKVLRFWNAELFEDSDTVIENIYRECVRRIGSEPRFTGRITEWGQFTPPAGNSEPG